MNCSGVYYASSLKGIVIWLSMAAIIYNICKQRPHPKFAFKWIVGWRNKNMKKNPDKNAKPKSSNYGKKHSSCLLDML